MGSVGRVLRRRRRCRTRPICWMRGAMLAARNGAMGRVVRLLRRRRGDPLLATGVHVWFGPASGSGGRASVQAPVRRALVVRCRPVEDVAVSGTRRSAAPALRRASAGWFRGRKFGVLFGVGHADSMSMRCALKRRRCDPTSSSFCEAPRHGAVLSLLTAALLDFVRRGWMVLSAAIAQPRASHRPMSPHAAERRVLPRNDRRTRWKADSADVDPKVRTPRTSTSRSI